MLQRKKKTTQVNLKLHNQILLLHLLKKNIAHPIHITLAHYNKRISHQSQLKHTLIRSPTIHHHSYAFTYIPLKTAQKTNCSSICICISLGTETDRAINKNGILTIQPQKILHTIIYYIAHLFHIKHCHYTIDKLTHSQ